MSRNRNGPGPIAWIGDPWAAAWAGPAGSGRWGPPADLTISLDDRGLLLADGLFETLRVEAGGALRLNVSRGGGGRGLDPPAAEQGRPQGDAEGARFWLTYTPGPAQFTPLRLVLSRLESRNAASLLSRCKTFAYGGAIQARREALARGADDALLASSAGGLCCGTAANLLIRRGGAWLTPPLDSGALPGVMRGRALTLDRVREESLSAADLAAAEAALLINSLGCRPIRRYEAAELPGLSPGEAEAFWRRLIAS